MPQERWRHPVSLSEQELNRMQQDARQRVQRMQQQASQALGSFSSAPPPANPAPPADPAAVPPAREERLPIDRDRLLILMILLLLGGDNRDPALLLALVYLML